MNKVMKFVIAIVLVLVLTYGGWIVISTIFPIEIWFDENPQWRPIFNILVIIGTIGLLAGLVEAKRR